jgi:hypothetical protein
MLALVAPHGFGGIEILEAAQAGCFEDAADGGGRDPNRLGDVGSREPLPAQGDHLVDDRSAGRAAQCLGTRRAIDQSGLTFSRKAGEPFMCGAPADARSACGGLRRLPA